MHCHVWRGFQPFQHQPLEVWLVELVDLGPARCARSVPVNLKERLEIRVLELVSHVRPDHWLEQRRQVAHQPQALQLANILMINTASSRQGVVGSPALIDVNRQPALREQQCRKHAHRTSTNDNDVFHRTSLPKTAKRLRPDTGGLPAGQESRNLHLNFSPGEPAGTYFAFEALIALRNSIFPSAQCSLSTLVFISG